MDANLKERLRNIGHRTCLICDQCLDLLVEEVVISVEKRTKEDRESFLDLCEERNVSLLAMEIVDLKRTLTEVEERDKRHVADLSKASLIVDAVKQCVEDEGGGYDVLASASWDETKKRFLRYYGPTKERSVSKELMKTIRAEFQHLMASERDVLLEQLQTDHEGLIQLQKDTVQDAQKE